MKKITITTTSFGKNDKKPLGLLEKNGFEVMLNPYGRKLGEKEIIELCWDAVGIIAGTEALDNDVMEELPNLRVISRCGASLDNIDLDAAKTKNIKIFNTPDAPTLAVAELTVGLILNLLRKITQMDTLIRNNEWKKLMGNLLYGKKVGIVGFGRIGRKVGELLSSFGAELAYCDTEAKPSSINCSRKEFKEILAWADIVTLHLSISAKMLSPLISDKELALMRKGSWLINTSRGNVIDEKALYDSLKNGHLSGAALDVFKEEPYLGKLRELHNILLTPHIGSYAKEARVKMELVAAKNLLTGLDNNK